MTAPAPGSDESPRRGGLYWRIHLVLLIGISVSMLLMLIAFYAISGHFGYVGIRLLPILLVSGTLAWLLRDRGGAKGA